MAFLDRKWHLGNTVSSPIVSLEIRMFFLLSFLVCFVFDFPSDTWSSYFSKPPPFFEITTSNSNKRRLKKNNAYVYWAQRSYSSVGRLFLFLFLFSSDNGVSGLSHAIYTLYISSTGTSFYMHACIVIYTLCKIAGFFLFLSPTTTENIYWEPMAFFLLFWAHHLSGHLILTTTL